MSRSDRSALPPAVEAAVDRRHRAAPHQAPARATAPPGAPVPGARSVAPAAGGRP
ncbi:hypothetical protein [Streptomyces tagetis]|uniref:Uncharacterized protein n=1 Tax=Streptomyces tagetis TaxID=2820809 RepID=A0A940XLX5_9ACTN|nr:hypothetical protein [Streptomyces sp. RG38]MBQ0826979.1 hypothetical protein [Streptomyces sp. RG38]